jgi:hypothetical protein
MNERLYRIGQTCYISSVLFLVAALITSCVSPHSAWLPGFFFPGAALGLAGSVVAFVDIGLDHFGQDES